jgi:hypothetical protein
VSKVNHKKGKVYKYRKLLFWAEGGCICIEDTSNEGNFKVVTRAEFAARVITLREYARRHTHRYADERIEDENFIVNGCAAIKEGKRQGDPFDPAVLEQMLREHRKTYVLGNGSVVIGHAKMQDESPSQKIELPPLPVATRSE